VCEYEQAGDTLLSLALKAGFEKVVTMLLERGADVNWTNTNVWGH
jgi:ankyrin repeat protein